MMLKSFQIHFTIINLMNQNIATIPLCLHFPLKAYCLLVVIWLLLK